MCYVLSLNRERAEAVTHVMHTHKRSVGISLQRFLHYRLVHITLIHQCVIMRFYYIEQNVEKIHVVKTSNEKVGHKQEKS